MVGIDTKEWIHGLQVIVTLNQRLEILQIVRVIGMVILAIITITLIIRLGKDHPFETIESGPPHPRLTLHRHHLIFRRLRMTFLHVTSFFREERFYQQMNLVDRPRRRASEPASGTEFPVDYRNEEEAYLRFRKLRDLKEREAGA
jgi:hypothetical protein